MARKNKDVTEESLRGKVEEALARRRGPREHHDTHPDKPTKFVVEYKDEQGNLASRWTYDLKKYPNGPISVEEFGPEFNKKTKKSTQS